MTPTAILASMLLLAAAPATAQSRAGVDVASTLGAPAGPPLEGDELTERTIALGSQMRCPVCQGSAIADSPSQQAVSMLGQVRELLAEGYSETQILDYFERSYGEFVRLQPHARGFNLIVWLAPIAMVLGGAALVVVRARRKLANEAAASEENLQRYLEQVRSEARR